MTDQNQSVEAVPLPQGFFDNSQARQDHFAAQVRAFEAAQPAAMQAPAVDPGRAWLAVSRRSSTLAQWP